MTKTVIECKDLTFQYQAQAEPTLKKINLSIKEGEKVLIIGPSGSGKSTLAQCFNGIIPHIHKGQHSGDLLLYGQSAFDWSIYKRSAYISTVLQDTDGQFIGLSVAEDLAFALENDGIPVSQMKEAVKLWGERLELATLLDHRPQDLSGGQKQRVSLAGVLIDESPILLFDEPLANLDPKSGQETIELIDSIHKETGATTIIIEHRLEDVLHCSVDRIILINDGEICYNGGPDGLLRTDLLEKNGIREPLYLTVLRQLGYPLATAKNLSDVKSLDLTGYTFPQVTLTQEKTSKPVLLSVENLAFSYDEENPILKDISVDFHKGERIAIVGKNGAGKSTFAKSLCRFVAASGKLRYHGQSIDDDSVAERAARIGYVLQNPNQMISQTMIFDEVALGLRLRGIPEEEVEKRTLEALQVCGLYAFRKWPISALSYGQKKRVTIASILVLNPEMIILDEPTAGQDERHYTEMMDFLDRLQELGHTIVMITHDMQLMLEHSDRALVLVDGQVLADASPIAILNRQEILDQANLKPTSLFYLAKELGVSAESVTAYYRKGRKEKA